MTIYRGLFIHSLVGHLDCSHLLGIVNNAAVNIHAQVFCARMFSFSGRHIPRIGIIGSHGNFFFFTIAILSGVASRLNLHFSDD